MMSFGGHFQTDTVLVDTFRLMPFSGHFQNDAIWSTLSE